MPIEHVPPLQIGAAFGNEQTVPHMPQLLVSFWTLTSQPLPAIRSQLAKPMLQENVHMPAWQSGCPFGTDGHWPDVRHPVVVVVLLVLVAVVLVVGAGSGAQRRLVPFAVTWCVPNWS